MTWDNLITFVEQTVDRRMAKSVLISTKVKMTCQEFCRIATSLQER